MKRLFILSCLIVCITAIAHAQTYTQHLQQKAAGKGSVVVTQSEEIDKLVNTANVNPRQQETAHKPATAEKPTSTAVKTTPTAASKSQNLENDPDLLTETICLGLFLSSSIKLRSERIFT